MKSEFEKVKRGMIMFKKGMKLSTVKEKMKRFSWWKFEKEIDFKDGIHNNLIYHCGLDTCCFWFQNGKLAAWTGGGN